MTKTTNIQNKTELLNLSNKLGDELVAIEGEINTIKVKLDAASNYDGLNFEGAASVIKTNLTNVLTAMSTLSSNISSYVTSLNEFDQYENPVPDDELTAPELTPPDETIAPPAGEEEQTKDEESDGTAPEETKPDETPDNTPPTTTPTTPPAEEKPDNTPPTTTPTTPPAEEKPEDKPEDKPKPSNPGPSNPGPSNPGPSNPGPSNPGTEQTPEFKPEELDATVPVVVGKGDVNVDISNFTNSEELGYVVTTGNTSFELGEEDFNLLCAIIEAESDGTYDGTLAVASAVLNRCENAEYLQLHGMDPIAQITALDQFDGYTSGEFQQYMNKNSDIVIEAVKAALAGVRNHTQCTFN